MRKLFDPILLWMARIVLKYKPKLLEEKLNAEVMRMSSELSIRTSMAFLDKEGLMHCAFCAQRFGLRLEKVNYGEKIREVYLCQNHLSKAIREPVLA